MVEVVFHYRLSSILGWSYKLKFKIWERFDSAFDILRVSSIEGQLYSLNTQCLSVAHSLSLKFEEDVIRGWLLRYSTFDIFWGLLPLEVVSFYTIFNLGWFSHLIYNIWERSYQSLLLFILFILGCLPLEVVFITNNFQY